MKYVEKIKPAGQIAGFDDLAEKLCIGPEAEWLPDCRSKSAWFENFPIAVWLIKTLKPSVVVELGTHFGFSYMAFCQAVKAFELPSKCYAGDVWEGDSQAGYYD